MSNVSFEIEFNDSGDAIIRLPEGKIQQIQAAEVADMTEAIAKAIGKIKERHIGNHTHHDHVHGADHVHA